jgi:hypothetical protein
MKNIAVQGLTLAPQGIVSGGSIAISSSPSTKIKGMSNGAYSGPFQFTVSGANATGYDPGTVMTVGPATISPSATKVKDKNTGNAVLLEGDQVAAAAMTGTIGGTPTPFTEPWKVTAAGQTKVKGN